MITVVAGVLGLAGVLATAAASIYNARTFPTLDRRVREHTALVKDMSDSIAEPLRKLLTEEVNELVARERRRLTPAAERRAGKTRLLLGVAFFAALGLLANAAVETVFSSEPTTQPPSDWLMVTSLVLVGAVLLMTLGLAVYLAVNWRKATHTGPPVYGRQP